MILTGPSSCADYFATIDRFVSKVLGEEARKQYEIIIDDPVAVARHAKLAMDKIKQQRFEKGDAYSFNWTLKLILFYKHRLNRITNQWQRLIFI